MRALVLGFAEFEIVSRALHVCTAGGDLFLARSSNKLVQPCLALCERCLGFPDPGKYPSLVLLQKKVSGRNTLSFLYEDLHNRFGNFGGDFNPVGLELANNSRVATGRIAARHCDSYGGTYRQRSQGP